MAQKSLTFGQYRAADLTIFAVILCALEGVIGVAANKWFPEQLFTVTLVYALVCLVFMRWGAFGVIHAVLGGLTYALANGGDAKQYLIYGLGNAFAALTMLYVHFVGKERIRKNVWLTMAHVLLTYLTIAIGRTLTALIFEGNVIDLFAGFAGTDALSAVIGLIIVLICRKQNGLYEDQKLYLVRTQEQRMKEIRQSEVDEEDIYKQYPFLKKPEGRIKTDDCEPRDDCEVNSDGKDASDALAEDLDETSDTEL